MILNSILPNKSGLGSIGTSYYSWGQSFIESANFESCTVGSWLSFTSISAGNMFADTADKLYNQDGRLYWAGDPIMLGTIDEIIDYINDSGKISFDSIIGFPGFSTADNGKYLNIQSGVLQWTTPNISWTDVGGPTYSTGNEGKILKVTDTGLEWAKDMDINSLPSFDPGDPVALNDLLAVDDISGTESKKITLRDLVGIYQTEKANEISGLDATHPMSGATTQGSYINGVWTPSEISTITSENIDSLIEPGTGFGIKTICKDSRYNVVDCDSPNVVYKTKKLFFSPGIPQFTAFNHAIIPYAAYNPDFGWQTIDLSSILPTYSEYIFLRARSAEGVVQYKQYDASGQNFDIITAANAGESSSADNYFVWHNPIKYSIDAGPTINTSHSSLEYNAYRHPDDYKKKFFGGRGAAEGTYSVGLEIIGYAI